MKTPLLVLMVAGLLFALTSCTDFLERKPKTDELVGKWEVTWVAGSVKRWLGNSGIRELPVRAGIELRSDGTFVATNLPYAYTRSDSVDKCFTINQGGMWKLVDSSNDRDLVKWLLEIAPSDLNQVCRLVLHEDSRGIYLDNPIDWESTKSVELRKSM
jgi:hypothetical protein